MLRRVDFKVTDFNDLITEKGYRLRWSQRVRCPCVDPATQRGVEGCPQCDGRGNFYFGFTEIKGIITRQDKELQIGESVGALEPGDAYLTTSSNNKLGFQDRITNLDSVVMKMETLLHTETGTDQLSYPPVEPISYAAWQPTKNSNVIPLTEGADYSIDANTGIITWLNNNKPNDGSGVSFRYICHPVWLVWDVPNYVRDTFVKFGNPTDEWEAMPLRVRMRLEFLGPSKNG